MLYCGNSFWQGKRSRCEVGFNNSPQDNTPYREQGQADESYFVAKRGITASENNNRSKRSGSAQTPPNLDLSQLQEEDDDEIDE